VSGPQVPFPPVRPRGRVLRLTVFISESDTWRRRPLYSEIVHRAHQAGLAGASVFRGIEGFGASNHIHTGRILSLSEDLPLVIVIVDAAERVEAFLPRLDELIEEGLALLDEVEALPRVESASPAEPGQHP
jgi:PII-like signaling protein